MGLATVATSMKRRSIPLSGCARVIYDVAKLRYPSAVDWRWGCAATGVDLAANKARAACSRAKPRPKTLLF